MLETRLIKIERNILIQIVWLICGCAWSFQLAAQETDFTNLIENARQNLASSTLPQLGVEKNKLQEAMRTLEHYLNPQGTENGKKWMETLKWSLLQQELAGEQPDGNRLLDVHAAFQQNYLGLEYGPFVRVRDALAGYINSLRYGANPDGAIKNLDDLLTSLGSVLRKSSQGADTERIRQIGTALWRLHGSRQAPKLVSAIRSVYAQPNFLIHVDESFVNQLLGRSVAEPSPVNECVLGTHVTGTACLSGQVTGDLVPNGNGVSLVINLGANFSSNNVGYNRGVLVRSTGAAHVNASKLIVFSPFGFSANPVITSQPTSVVAPLSSNIFSIEHRMRLIRRIASKKAAQMQPAANAIGQGRLENRIAQQFDETIGQQLASANGRLSSVNQHPPELRRLGIPQPSWSVYSTANSVEASLIERADHQLAASGSCPLPRPLSGIVCEVHQSVVTNVTDLVLGGRIIRNEDLDDLAQQFLGRVPDELWSEVEADETWSITLAQYRPFELEFDDGYIKFAMRAVDFKKGDRGLNQPTTITARFLPVRVGNTIHLQRQGDVDIQLAQERGLGVVTMRAFMKSKFDKLFPEKTKDHSFDATRIAPNLPFVSLEHLALDDGWLQLGLR